MVNEGYGWLKNYICGKSFDNDIEGESGKDGVIKEALISTLYA